MKYESRLEPKTHLYKGSLLLCPYVFVRFDAYLQLEVRRALWIMARTASALLRFLTLGVCSLAYFSAFGVARETAKHKIDAKRIAAAKRWNDARAASVQQGDLNKRATVKNITFSNPKASGTVLYTRSLGEGKDPDIA